MHKRNYRFGIGLSALNARSTQRYYRNYSEIHKDCHNGVDGTHCYSRAKLIGNKIFVYFVKAVVLVLGL